MITADNLVSMASHAALHSAHLALTVIGLKITVNKGDSLSIRVVPYEELSDARFPAVLVACQIEMMEEEFTS